MSWKFLKATLQANGFDDYWVNIILTYVKTVSYQVLINGDPKKQFFLNSGLQQGDPLSPYLFVICQNVFSLLSNKYEREGKIEGLKVSQNSIPISHLLLANDNFIFSK